MKGRVPSSFLWLPPCQTPYRCHYLVTRMLHRTFVTPSTRNQVPSTMVAAEVDPDVDMAAPAQFKPLGPVDEVMARRARAGKLVAGTAAYSDSDMFKGPTTGKPLARRWDGHLTAEALSRKPCVLKQAAQHLKKPGMISLGGGLPHPANFPIESISVKVAAPPLFSEEDTLRAGETVAVGKYDVSAALAAEQGVVFPDLKGSDGVLARARPPPPGRVADAVYDLSIALNYGQAQGSAQLLRFVTEHTELAHAPPYADWGSCLTIGSTGALEQAFRMLLDKERGDGLVTDEWAFSTALETAIPLGARVWGAEMDGEGIVPARLDEMLAAWDADGSRHGAKKPHVLYTVPSGQNPTGATMGAQRRRDLYEVARRHDLFIVEDEPYYFLQMEPYVPGGGSSASSDTAVDPTVPSTDATSPPIETTFLPTLIPSLLSLDVDGRVLRLDSFSKVFVPGARLGWVTASAQVVERYLRHAEVASQGPSGISQAVLHRVLDEAWGHRGYLAWLKWLAGEYAGRRDAMMRACEKHLPTEVVSWEPPKAGMFLWLKVDHTLHPSYPSRDILSIEEEIFDGSIRRGALVGRGSWFRAEHEKPPSGLFFRTTYAMASPENMDEAVRRFGESVRESFGLL